MNENQPPTEEEQAPEDRGESSEPEWLRDMSGDQEAPEWLRRLFDVQSSTGLSADAGLPADARLSTDAGQLADADLPAQEEPDEAPPAVEAERPADVEDGRSATDELRQWFRSAEGELDLPEDKDALPEWLQALDATELSPGEPELPEETLAEPQESEEVPSWLRNLGEQVEEPVPDESDQAPLPDWLRDLDDRPSIVEEPPAPADAPPVAAPQETGDLPDWLVEMTEEVAGEPQQAGIAAPEEPVQVEEPLAPEEPPEEALEERPAAEELWAAEELAPTEELLATAELPGDLAATRELLEKPPEELPPSIEAELPEEVEPVKDQAALAGAVLGEKLTRVLPAETEEPAEPEVVAPELSAEDAGREQEAPLWLTEVDQVPPDEMLAPAEPLLEAEDEDEAIVPEWLAEVDEAPIEEVEAPEWMQDLRGEPEEESEPEPDLEVETSGPLAGLAGLLSPQPLAGLSSKATFQPAPAVPEEHHILASRVREMLSEPPARPELSVDAPGRTVMRALGHWLIYLALVAVIIAAMFVPALQDLVLAPETVASKDAYVTLLALPPGSEVLLVVDYDAAHDGELTPLTRVLLWHLITSGQRVVVVSHTPQGTAMAEDLIESRALWAYGPAPVAGEQVLNLGYLPPHPVSMQAFMADPLGGAVLWGGGTGAYPERAQDTPLGQEIAGFGDLDAIVLVSASQEHTRWWIEQTRQAAPMVAAVSASVAPTLLPYYGTTGNGQLGGMLVGLAGAAEYERLCRASFVPSARQNMILQGSAQILLAAIVLVSGISLVVRRAIGREG